MSPEEWQAQREARQQQQQVLPSEQPTSPEQWVSQQPENQPTDYSGIAAGKSLIENVIPAASAVLGSAIVGTGGSFLGPAGTVGGIAIGGLKGQSIGEDVNEWVAQQIPEDTKKFFGFGKAQREAEQAKYPTASMIGKYSPDVLGAVTPSKLMGGGILKFAADKAIREASPAQREILPIAEQWGLKLKPTQLLKSGDQQIAGNAHNQGIINQKVAEATGAPIGTKVDAVDSKFLTGRLKDLSGRYDAIYNDPSLGQVIKLPNSLKSDLVALRDSPIAKLGKKEQGAIDEIVKSMQDINPATLTQQVESPMGGRTFQDAISKLKTVERESKDADQRREVLELISKLNEGLEAANPTVAAKLAEINPMYRAAKTLDNLYYSKNNALSVKGDVDAYELGKYLRTQEGKGRNPLQEIGKVGELLGIGANRKGIRFSDAASSADPTLYGIQGKLNLFQKARDLAVRNYDVLDRKSPKTLAKTIMGTNAATNLGYKNIMGEQ